MWDMPVEERPVLRAENASLRNHNAKILQQNIKLMYENVSAKESFNNDKTIVIGSRLVYGLIEDSIKDTDVMFTH